jgi:RNA polymerase sigma-70 factor (ECF subfamily)
MQREETLVAAATGGDEQAFALLTQPHRRALHLHCYRLLGSLDDADDAVQETMLRAWRGLDRFEPRAPLVAWLHTIATNVCLTALRNRRTRDLLHLQPYPDRLLDDLEAPTPGPEARLALRESVELAFVTAVQLLPPKQRAVLILRDVLGWSARETADALGDSVAAVNSALQRARTGVDRARTANPAGHALRDPERERALLERFMAAWDAIDIDGLVELLTADALMTMPPVPMRVAGAAAIGEFFATVPADGRLNEIHLVATRANGQPAVAAYMRGEAYGVMVFSLTDDSVAGIVGFAHESLFPRFGLPLQLDD